MLPKDKIKAIVAACLVLLLITTFLIVGKDGVAMKYASAFCLLTWVITMVTLNRKFK